MIDEKQEEKIIMGALDEFAPKTGRWTVYEGETLLYAGEDRQRALLLFGEAFHRRKEHVRLLRGTEVYADYSLKPEGA